MHNSRSLSPSSSKRILVKNRRMRYLDLHPEYFEGPDLELADPLAYDRLVRRFQTSSEREKEGRKKGYSGVLEADLIRSEAKIEALKHPDAVAQARYRRDDQGQIIAEEHDEVPASKEEGLAWWRKEMELRFLRGDDQDFDYGEVDENDALDDLDAWERDKQDEWFEAEEPSSVYEGGTSSGETGVQDF